MNELVEHYNKNSHKKQNKKNKFSSKGVQKKQNAKLLNCTCTEFHDSLIIDKSRPYAKLRRNLFEVIPYHKR